MPDFGRPPVPVDICSLPGIGRALTTALDAHYETNVTLQPCQPGPTSDFILSNAQWQVTVPNDPGSRVLEIEVVKSNGVPQTGFNVDPPTLDGEAVEGNITGPGNLTMWIGHPKKDEAGDIVDADYSIVTLGDYGPFGLTGWTTPQGKAAALAMRPVIDIVARAAFPPAA
jgi:hypothetical protein